jgi:chromate transporter
MFVPGILALMGILPFWHELRARSGARATMAGVNAAVVGLLGAALYNPVWTSAVLTPADFLVATAAFVLLVVWNAPPLIAVLLCATAGVGLGLA